MRVATRTISGITILVALILGATLFLVIPSGSAAPSEGAAAVPVPSCVKPTGASVSNRQVLNYTDCRFKRVEALLANLGQDPSTTPPSTPPSDSVPSDTAAPSATPSTSAPSTPTPTTPTATPSKPSTGTVCQSPTWTTSTPDESRTWADPLGSGFPDGVGAYGQYMVHNNVWAASGYNVTQTVRACDYDSWSATTKADNSTGDGAVKTYPNVHVDYIDWGTGKMPALSTFSSLKARFAHQAPTTAGIWNVAFDVWLNGIGNGSANELMIWTENHNQVPAGTRIATVTLEGIEWGVWKGYQGHYLAFVPTGDRVVASGELNLLAFTDWLAARGHLPANSTLGQVDYGVEVVSTNGAPARFDFTDFGITEVAR